MRRKGTLLGGHVVSISEFSTLPEGVAQKSQAVWIVVTYAM
jgi:hypothetical protein